MASPSLAVTPVASLQEQATALEAAITVCMAKPAAKPVHQVRTATRRIEAQLELLALLPEAPEHKKPAERLRRQLARLRRAAGRVRDLDVLRDKLKKPDAEPELWGQDCGKQMQKESRRLGKQLKARRDQEAEALVQILKARQADVVRALGKLLEALAPAEELSLPVAELIEVSLSWFAPHAAAASADGGEEALHDTRKAAKLVRYVLESAPDSAKKAHQLAARFEALQQSGGHWHDLLTLAEQARKRLGKKSELAEHAGRLRDESLASYRAELAELRTE